MASEIAAWKAVGLLVRPPGKAPFASSTIVRFFFLSAQTKEPEGKSLRPNESGLALNLCPQGQSFAGTVSHLVVPYFWRIYWTVIAILTKMRWNIRYSQAASGHPEAGRRPSRHPGAPTSAWTFLWAAGAISWRPAQPHSFRPTSTSTPRPHLALPPITLAPPQPQKSVCRSPYGERNRCSSVSSSRGGEAHYTHKRSRSRIRSDSAWADSPW